MAMAEPFNYKTAAKLEKQWMPRKRGETYIACESVDFQWSIDEVAKFIKIWKSGASLMRLSQTFRRTQTDIAVLILDLRLKGKIEPREKGLLG
jgi:hypothetical protein